MTVKKLVADQWGVTPEGLDSQVRIRSLVEPRQVAMYLAREVCLMPLADIGQAFGGRDHSTVIHSIEKVKRLVRTEEKLGAKVALVRQQLADLSHTVRVNGQNYNGENQPVHTVAGFSTLSTSKSPLGEGPKANIEDWFTATANNSTDSASSSKIFNKAVEALFSIPDPVARLYLWRAWKNYCRLLVGRAVLKGKIKRMPCERCTAAIAEAHHPDYRQPYRVVWLCDQCHQGLESEQGVPNR